MLLNGHSVIGGTPSQAALQIYQGDVVWYRGLIIAVN